MKDVDLARNWEIIKILAWTDFKVRYNNSILGYFWSLFRPLMMFGILMLVFSLFLKFNIPYYPIYLLLGIILWNYFAEATISGMNSLQIKQNVIKKIQISPFSVVIASSIVSVITLMLTLIVFFLFYFLSGLHFSWTALMFPLYILQLFVLTAGVSLLLSALYVRFKDMQNIWEILLQIGFWATPIFYSIDVLPRQYLRYFLLNPMARVIQDCRYVLIYGQLPYFRYALVSIGATIFIFLVGFFVFKKKSPKIAEEL